MLGFLKGRKKKEVQEEQPKDTREMALILLVEKRLPDMRNFFSDKGLNIIEIYTDIEEAKIGLLIQSGACRLVIIEAGLGTFTTTSMRAELSDLLGMCDGVDKKATIFFTDSILKSDNTKGKKVAGVEWTPYDNTVGVINKLLSYQERYTASDEQSEALKTFNEVMKFTGEPIDEALKNAVRPQSDNIVNELLLLLKSDCSEEDTLPLFEPVY